MRAFIGVVSSDAQSLSLVQKEQASLVAEQLRRDPRFTAKGSALSIGAYDPNSNKESLMDFVFNRSEGMDVAALIVEGEPNVQLEPLSPAILVGRVAVGHAQPRMSLEAALNRILRNLLAIHALTSDEKHLEVLLLPRRNFVADDLNELIGLGLRGGADDQFFAQVSSILASLRRRKRPRRRAKVDQRKRYLVDDKNKLFEYGFEIHSRYETGDPHTKSCVLAARYRLGAKIPNEQRHYNMTKEKGSETWIAGEFPDCHQQLKSVDHSHVNIFASDYH